MATDAKQVIVTGATGMIGGGVLRLCLEHPHIARVTALGRRRTGLTHPKLTEVLTADFNTPGEWTKALTGQDVAFFCLGTYTGSVSDKELHRVTVDLAVEFARALHAVSPNATFCLPSGMGADRTERSRIAFARYKGMAENALTRIGFARVCFFRPGYIYPVAPRREPNLFYRLCRLVYPVVRHIYPDFGVRSDQLAQAMVEVGLDNSRPAGEIVMENRDLRTLTAG